MQVDVRFWSKVDKSGPIPASRPDLGRCWVWVARLISNGSGLFWFSDRQAKAHRWAWEQVNGPLPDGMDLYHLCRVNRCVNLGHLELVTHGELLARVTEDRRFFCLQGHPYDKSTGNALHARRTRCPSCK